MSTGAEGKSPDISRIISVIMENPDLIEQISSLVKEAPPDEPKEVEETPAAEVEETPSAEVEASALPSSGQDLRSRREHLLSALKPYLSDERQRAIDSMMTFADILDAVRRT